MKHLLLLVLLFSCVGIIHAQHLAEGLVFDEEENPLTGATIVLLDHIDSSMIAFSISDNRGHFDLEDVAAGAHILQISFLSFKTISQDVLVEGPDRKVDLGLFKLESFTEILQEVTVKAEHIPMGLLGDTISYNAAAFKVRPGASVEDLLKKLPGVEVQRDGSIKAMGEDVENVLVDGKEFFGDDPKIATQNLEAEAIDKVQVFDKKSEIAEFTGIDDGNEEKSINLKLKEGYKRGGFGNIELAGGTESSYKTKVNYNRFGPQMQAAAIISANNINEQSFSFSEYIQFMGGLGNALSSNMGMVSFGDFGGGMAPQGISKDLSTGLNFNYDFSKKLKLTSHYFYLNSDRHLENITSSNQFTESLNFFSRDSTRSDRLNQNHRFHTKLDFKPNPFTQVIWKNTITGILGDLQSEAFTLFTQANEETGRTNSILSRMNDQVGYDGNFQLRKKFNKKGRNWINTATYQIGTLDEENQVLNEYLFGNVTTLINQLQRYRYDKNIWSISSAYTEPLGKQYYIGLNYSLNLDTEEPRKNFYDISEESNGTGEEATLNDDLSNEYYKATTIQRAFLSLKKNNKKLKLNAGIGFQTTDISGEIGEGKALIDNNSFNILPSLSFEFDLTSDQTIELGYRTSVNQPTLAQLSPLPDNSNPNILISGNPNLTPENVHNLNLGYHIIDQFNFKNFFFNVNMNLIDNRIINEIAINENLIKTLSPINTDGYKRVSGFTSFSAPIRPLKLKFNISTQYSWSNYESSINDLSSNVKESNVYLKFVLENRMKDYVDIATGVRLDYSTRNYDINDDFNQQFSNTRLFVDGSLYLGEEWTINSSFDYVSYSGEFFSEGQKFKLWHASIRKSFADDKIAIEVRVNDLLDQNKGIRRSGDINTLYETKYNTLSRYVMLGLKYKFGRRKGGEGIDIH